MLIHVEFSGGLELLFNNVHKHDITLDDTSKKPTLKDLIFHIRDTMMTERENLFVENDTVRPGILVLINDIDWELCDELAYELENKDNIVFISTLHGG